ncbi:PstS family phosphate ABC transporter substrate-binding protein [Candidatus Bathyarchaeota archaeon]|nr:PstS family phosphate ABC transporter substrate-binding protein [Candidatus Bathyarchaeota archaeon]
MERKDLTGISTMVAVLGMIVLLIVGFAAGYYLNTPSSTSTDDDSAWRTQSITLAGSTTVLPIANASAVDFMNIYSGVTVTVSGGGSGTGYSNIIDDVVDIGMGSREPKQSEIDNAKTKGRPMYLYPIALDAVCVVVNPSVDGGNQLGLTLQMIGQIFSGEYTRWNQIDSSLPDQEIFVVVREPGSGTRGTFEEFTMDPWDYEVTTAANARQSNPEVVTTVSGTPYSIGYVGFGFLNQDMHTVSVYSESQGDLVLPTAASIADQTYPMSRYLYLVTNERPASGSLTDRFMDFIYSSAGQDIVEQKGFLKLPEYP